jgi:hypothetical protein
VVLRSSRRDWLRVPILCATVWAASLHQLGLALLCAATDLALFQQRGAGLQRGLPSWLGASACGVFWSLVLVPRTSGWREPLLALFGYPNVLQHYLYFLATGWPVVTLGAVAGGALLARELLRDRRSARAAFVLAALIVPLVATSFFRSFFEARYLFHLFPLVLALYGFAAVRLADGVALRTPEGLRKIVGVCVLLLALVATGEADPAAAWAVGRRQHSTQLDAGKGVLSWIPYADFHQDHATPSRYVLDHRAAGDRVVVMGAPHMLGVYAHYLGPIDFAIARRQDQGYMRLRGDRRVGWLTGIPLLTEPDELKQVLRPPAQGATWLLADRVLLRADTDYFDEPTKQIVRALSGVPEYVGRDGRTFVARLR